MSLKHTLACRDKPRSISDGEKQSLLFNIACCHSQLQDARTGLVALAGGQNARVPVIGLYKSMMMRTLLLEIAFAKLDSLALPYFANLSPWANHGWMRD